MITIGDFVPINITEKIKTLAKERAKTRLIASKKGSVIDDNAEYMGIIAELCVHKWLLENGRKSELIVVEGKSDGGIDILIKAGSIDVKSNKIEPSPNCYLFVRGDLPHNADFYIQCFVDEDICWFAGIGRKEEVIKEENKKQYPSKEGWDGTSYQVRVRDLSIKPSEILSDEYTDKSEVL